MSTPAATTVRPKLDSWETAAAWVFGIMMILIGVGGFVVSFATIEVAMRPSLGGLAWVIPVVVDVSIVAFTAIDLLHARLGMRSRLLRFVPLLFIAGTGYLNVAHAWSQGDAKGAVGHAAAPFAWSVAVEVSAHTVRRWVGIADTTTSRRMRAEQMDRVRLNRWFWAPAQTIRLRRRMSLREQRSYDTAVADDLQWRLAKARLQDQYCTTTPVIGRWAWRWNAPAELLVLLRQGALHPAHIASAPAEAPGGTTAVPALVNGNGSAPKPQPAEQAGVTRNGRVRKRGRKGSSGRSLEHDELVTEVRQLQAEHGDLSLRKLSDHLRAKGVKFSNSKLGQAVKAAQAAEVTA